MFITPANAARIYEAFVTIVDNSNEVCSRQDWGEIEGLYEGMNTRKDQIEKEISGKDKQKIMGQKVRFAAIKGFKRPMSESELK